MKVIKRILIVFLVFSIDVHVKANESYDSASSAPAENFKKYVQYPLDCWQSSLECLITTMKSPAVVSRIGLLLKMDSESVIFRDKNHRIHFVKGTVQFFSSEKLEVQTEFGSIEGQNIKFWLGRRERNPNIYVASIDGMLQLTVRKHKMKSMPLPSGFESYIGPQGHFGNQLSTPYAFDDKTWSPSYSESFARLTALDIQGVLALKSKNVGAVASLYQESVDIAISEADKKRAEQETREKSEAEETHRMRKMFKERFGNLAE